MTRPSAAADQVAERLPHRGLGQGVALALGAGRVGEEEAPRPACPISAMSPRSARRPVGRGVVELEVAGWMIVPARRADGKADPAGNRVVDPEGGDLERTDGELDRRLDHARRGRAEELVLLQLAGDQADGQLRGVDRRALDPGQDVGQATGVVLVTVGQQDGLTLLAFSAR